MTQTLEDKRHREKFAKFYEPGLLDPNKHQKLVENLERVCAAGRIPPLYVYGCPLSKFCAGLDLDWVREFYAWPGKSVAGLAYVGAVSGVEDRMMAIAGALTRNYIEARVLTVQEVIAYVKDDDTPLCSCLLIPNFYLPNDQGGKLPDWQVSMLTSCLMARFARGLQTVLYITNEKKMTLDYGAMLASHVDGHYVHMEVG